MPFAADPQTPPQLSISTEKVCRIIVLARQFDVKEGDGELEDGSNPSDDGMSVILEDNKDDAVREELIRYIAGLDVEEQVHLVALAWLGRGTYDLGEWREAIETARGEHNGRTAHYLLTLPLLGDYLEEGLAAFGESCTGFGSEI